MTRDPRKFRVEYRRWEQRRTVIDVMADNSTQAERFARETFNTRNDDGEIDWQPTGEAECEQFHSTKEADGGKTD